MPLIQAMGRAGMWSLTAVDEGTAAVAGAGGGATGALLPALGPLSRAVRRCAQVGRGSAVLGRRLRPDVASVAWLLRTVRTRAERPGHGR